MMQEEDDDDFFNDPVVMEQLDMAMQGGIPSTSHMQIAVDYEKTSTSIKSPHHHEIDMENIKTWIFPINYPKRLYQFNIVRNCLFNNTLVSLPTGLGKTFIAAVVMFNFYRWFPRGKILFLAPTRPLVTQQLDACFKITGVSQLETCELTGSQNPSLRQQQWHEKRLFFATPQIFQNDLEAGLVNARDVVCVVFDEAHRATGNYAYCECVRLLRERRAEFRVLALSATPGSDQGTVQQVLNNLLISRIDMRTEESIDTREYSHFRQQQTIVVQPNELMKCIIGKFVDILRSHLEKLNRYGALSDSDPSRHSKYALVETRKRWKMQSNNRRNSLSGVIESEFAISISLFHAFELLTRHGITPFYRYMYATIHDSSSMSNGNTSSNTPKSVQGHLRKNQNLLNLLETIKAEMQKPTFVGHPKLDRLESVILKHFSDHCENSTRVIVFSEYRDSVDDIVNTLGKHSPLLRVMAFVGQTSSRGGKGFSQKEQLKVLKQFNEGGYNVLVATSIGEEGLDIGEVDLIVCFDSQSSPIRMLQRMGRTGRKRQGRIVTLLSQGKEEQQYQRVQQNYKKVQSILSSGKLTMFQDNLRMVPEGLKPEPVEMMLEIPERQETIIPKRTRTSKQLTQEKLSLMSQTDWRIFNTLYRCDETVELRPERQIHWQTTKQLSNVGQALQRNIYVDLMAELSDIAMECLKNGEIKEENIFKIPEPKLKQKIVLEESFDFEDDFSFEDDFEMVVDTGIKAEEKFPIVSKNVIIDNEFIKESVNSSAADIARQIIDTNDGLASLQLLNNLFQCPLDDFQLNFTPESTTNPHHDDSTPKSVKKPLYQIIEDSDQTTTFASKKSIEYSFDDDDDDFMCVDITVDPKLRTEPPVLFTAKTQSTTTESSPIVFKRKKRIVLQSENDVSSSDIVKRKRNPVKNKFEFIEVEAVQDSDSVSSGVDEEESDYDSSLDGFIRFSQSQASCSSPIFKEPSQPRDSKYKMKFQGSVPLSQKLVGGNHRYQWMSDGAMTDDSFVCPDSHVDFESGNSILSSNS